MLEKRRGIAAVVVLAAAFGGLHTVRASTASAEVESVDMWTLPGEGDGLNRFVVTLEPSAGADTATTKPTASTRRAATATPSTTGSAEHGSIDGSLYAAAIRALGSGGRVGYDSQGRVAYLKDGRSSPLTKGARKAAPRPATAGGGTFQQEPAAAPASSRVAEAVDALAAVPGISTAQALHSGDILVATRLSLAQVESLPGVAVVRDSPTMAVASLSSPNDDAWQYAWSLQNKGYAYNQNATAGTDVNPFPAWEQTTGQGTVVAVIDTGFYKEHVDLQGALWDNPAEVCGGGDLDGNGKAGDCHGWNFLLNNADIANGGGDSASHGTSVAGTIAARIDNNVGAAGLAPGAKIMPLVVGTSASIDVALAAEAVRYAVDHGATVINASFGGPSFDWAARALEDSIRYAGAHGVVVVAAAGNDARDREVTPMYPASFPEDNIISVASSTATDSASVFTAWGAKSVDLHAPGEKVYTTWNDGGYRIASGTSTASPHVAAAVALYRSLHPTSTNAEVKQAILANSRKVAAFAGRSVSGGSLDVGFLGYGAKGLQYRFGGAGRVPVGPAAPTITVSGKAAGAALGLKLTLAVRQSGLVWAVGGEKLTLDGVVATSDDTGSATFALPAGTDLATAPTFTAGVDLPEGDYALLAQVLDNGQPLSRPYAVPLLVGDEPVTAPAQPAPSQPAPSQPTTPRPPAPAPSGSAAPSRAASAAPVTPVTPVTPVAPRASEPAAPVPSQSATRPGPAATATAVTKAPAPSPGATSPTAPGSPGASSTPRPSQAAPAPSASSVAAKPTVPAAPTTAPGGGTGTDGARTYPGTGTYGITRISPAVVSAAGGTLVTVYGANLPINPYVLVGDSGTVGNVASNRGMLLFRTQPHAAGTYALTFSAPGLGSERLENALTFVAPAGGSTPTAAPGVSAPAAPRPSASAAPSTSTAPVVPRAPAPSSTPSARASSVPVPSAPGAPAPSTSAAPVAPRPSASSSAPAPSAGASAPAVTPSAAPTGGTGTGGRTVRRVSSSSLSGLDPAIWAMTGCGTGCAGLQV